MNTTTDTHVHDPEAAHVLAIRTDQDRIRLDCGDIAEPSYTLVPNWRDYDGTPGMGAAGWPGYATTADGRKICQRHSDESERAVMLTAHAQGTLFVGYVDSDARHITTWPGGVLADVLHHGSNRSGFGRSPIHYYTVRDVHGNTWHGRNGGPGMAIRLRPSKRS